MLPWNHHLNALMKALLRSKPNRLRKQLWQNNKTASVKQKSFRVSAGCKNFFESQLWSSSSSESFNQEWRIRRRRKSILEFLDQLLKRLKGIKKPRQQYRAHRLSLFFAQESHQRAQEYSNQVTSQAIVLISPPPPPPPHFCCFPSTTTTTTFLLTITSDRPSHLSLAFQA